MYRSAAESATWHSNVCDFLTSEISLSHTSPQYYYIHEYSETQSTKCVLPHPPHRTNDFSSHRVLPKCAHKITDLDHKHDHAAAVAVRSPYVPDRAVLHGFVRLVFSSPFEISALALTSGK